MIEIGFLPALLFCSGTLSLFLALYALHAKRSPLIHMFAMFAGAATIYAYGYGMELLSPSLSEMLFWSKVQYLGISFAPGLVLAIAISYTGKQGNLTRWQMGLVFIIPVITVVARWSNPFHHLFYRSVSMVPSDVGALLKIEAGPFYLIHMMFTNGTWLLSLFLLIRFMASASRPYRRQAMVIITGAVIQWMGLLVYLTGLGPAHIDITPLLLTLSVPVYTLGLLKFSLFNLVPVAREKVFENMGDAVLVMDTELRLVDFNRRCAHFFSQVCQENIGMPVPRLFEKKQPEVLLILTKDGAEQTRELAFGEEDEQLFFRLTRTSLTEKSGRAVGSILTFTDITVQKQFMVKLEKMATLDELTGLYNRRCLMDLCRAELNRFKRSQRAMALLIMDLDQFKKINDTWGHHFGDMVLKTFARQVKQKIRAMDIFGRFGGEEFIIVMPETDRRQAFQKAKRICAMVERLTVDARGGKIRFTVSIGVSGTWISKRPDLEALLLDADKALYEAKENGRNQAVLLN